MDLKLCFGHDKMIMLSNGRIYDKTINKKSEISQAPDLNIQK